MEGPLEDRLLVEKLLAKDREAENFFFRTYREKLYKTCVYILGYQDPDAEDITQETFLAALRKLPEFEFRSSLYTWLYRICVYLCYERLEKRRRQLGQEEEALEALAGPVSLARQQRDEETAEKNMMLALMEEKRELLGVPCRELLNMRDQEDQSYAQISKAIKAPIGTVMSRLARCKETLRRLMAEALEGKKDA
jgi:RNA polymerase sigma-70 factor (ECF subfamily)